MYQAPMYDQEQMQQQAAQQQMNQMDQQQMMQRQQPMMQQQQAVDPVAEAKAMLGLDKIEEQMMAQTAAMEAQKMQAIQSEMKSKYPTVSEDAVNKEIERIAESDPVLADAMRKSANGLETVYKAIIASSKPVETPDDHIDSSGTGGVNQSLEQKIKNGSASQIELGDYIIGNSK